MGSLSLEQKYARLATDNAPGQEVRQQDQSFHSLLRGDALPGRAVDFSHGDVDAHTPTPGAFEAFEEGVRLGGSRAYTEYRGDLAIREALAQRLADFTGFAVDGQQGLIVTPGTQSALFLAVAAAMTGGDKVAIVQPDYFANRKIVQFFEGDMVPVRMDYLAHQDRAGIDLGQLEDAFKAGARLFLFSNPNNPAGVIYSPDEIKAIASLANQYGVSVIADQLYSRLLYDGGDYTHLGANGMDPERLLTVIGPSKTESLSGYRLGVAFGSSTLVNRMEKLQAIVSLRAAGYCQSVLQTWFAEPAGWMTDRIAAHQAIRDDLLRVFRSVEGVQVRSPQAGSYLFPQLPKLAVSTQDFVRILRHQANVIVTPGSEFGPHVTDSVRLNFSQDHAAAVAAVERVAALIERYRA